MLCEMVGVCLATEVRHGYRGGIHARDEGTSWGDLRWAGHMVKCGSLKDRIRDPD